MSYNSKLSSSELAVKLALFFAKEKQIWKKMSGTDRITRIENILKEDEASVSESVIRNIAGEDAPSVVMDFVLEAPFVAERKKSLDAVLPEKEAQFLLEEDTPPVPTRKAPLPPTSPPASPVLESEELVTPPKRAMSGYMAYGCKRRAEMKISGINLGFGDITKQIAAEWNAMTDDEKEPFNAQAREDLERYRRECLQKI